MEGRQVGGALLLGTVLSILWLKATFWGFFGPWLP